MDYFNYFVNDVMELFDSRMIQIQNNMVMVDPEALYMLSTTYRMDNDDILYLLQKVMKFAEKING
jgi:hypothetical protein